MARPSRYDTEIAERVLLELRAGRPLRLVCTDPGMPSARTVQGWVNDDHDGFAVVYRQAREAGLGHPPGYTAELAERILHELRGGRTLIDVCRDDGMPLYATVQAWVTHDRFGFAAPYHAALRVGGARWARPTRYAEDIAVCIVAELGRGRSLEAVCADPLMPTPAAVRLWVMEDRDGFAARYRLAREFGCEILAAQMVDSADDQSDTWMPRRRKDGTIEWVLDRFELRRARLRCETLRWQLSRRLRDTYGGRQTKRRRGDPPSW